MRSRNPAYNCKMTPVPGDGEIRQRLTQQWCIDNQSRILDVYDAVIEKALLGQDDFLKIAYRMLMTPPTSNVEFSGDADSSDMVKRAFDHMPKEIREKIYSVVSEIGLR